MADQAGKTTGDGEVSNCVSNLIHAFTDGFNVFKRLRERRRKRKSKHKERESGWSGAELQLSNSLKKGPLELSERYESCYGDKGERFAKGDAIAHASLAETLIRFNTGLVRIIATFLHQDSKHSDLQLDYKSLTNLSDISRREAIDSLNSLYQRLSQSQLQLHRRDSKSEPEKKRRNSSRQRSQGRTVARVSVKSSGSSQTQLAMVRPRNSARRGSTSSSSAGRPKALSMSSSVKSPDDLTPPASPPLPEYSAKDPFPPQKTSPAKNNSPTAKKANPALILNTLPTPPEYFAMKTLSPHLPLPFSNAQANIARRRSEKPTPSTYTFASDSTKLGEIPQRNWTVPWNYEEAGRLNAEAAVKGHPVATATTEQKTKTRKGLRTLFKKG